MATWVDNTETSSGGNISLYVAGGYANVSRNGSTVSFDWGVRFQARSSGNNTWTYNSIAAEYNGSMYYAMKSDGSIHIDNGQKLYATSTSGTVTKYTGETVPFDYSTTVSGTGSGTIRVYVGVAWNCFTPSSGAWTYSFDVPYPAATSYTVRYYGNGGSSTVSNVPGNQTKYQGYTLSLSSQTPTRAGYRFDGWNTNSSGTGTNYSAGGTYSGNGNLSLYAKWTPLAPSYNAPALSATETSISWPSFSLNTSSNIYFRVNSGYWETLGTDTTTGSGKTLWNYRNSSGTWVDIFPGTYYTVEFRADNAQNTALETYRSTSISTYNYPSITSWSTGIDAGSRQSFSLYNPLGRSVTIALTSVNGNSPSTPYVSTSVSGTSASFILPLDKVATAMPDKSYTDDCVYTLTYNGVVRSTRTGSVYIPSSAAPTIDWYSNNYYNFLIYGDCGSFTLNGTRPMTDFTGGDWKLVQGYSTLYFKLQSGKSPFSGQYGADIVQYDVAINDVSARVAVGTTYYENVNGGFTTSSANAKKLAYRSTYSFTIYARDSRGHTSSYTISTSTYPAYSPSPSISSVIRNDGYGSDVTLTISGSWCDSMTGKHAGKQLVLYYKPVTSSTWNSYTLYNNSNATSTSYRSLASTYSLAGLISFDSGTAYEMYVEAQNGLGSWGSSSIKSLALGVPIFFMDAYQHGVGVNCFPDSKGLYVDGYTNLKGNLSTQNITCGNITGNEIVANYIRSTGYMDVQGDLSVIGNIYSRNGYRVLDTGNYGSYALPLSGGIMQGPITLKDDGSHSNLILNTSGGDGSYGAGIGYDWAGNECVALWSSFNPTALRWHAGINMTNMTNNMMLGIVPDFEVVKNSDGTCPQIHKGGQDVPAVYIQSSSPSSTNLQKGDIWFVT